jgi:hypothetical protein
MMAPNEMADMNRRLFVLAALALAGCASHGPAPRLVPADVALAELEPLYAARGGPDGLAIEVGSNGCTAKADFTFYVERRGKVVTLSFARRRLDSCKSLAIGKTEIVFTWDELGVPRGEQVFLLNPVVAWTGPGA